MAPLGSTQRTSVILLLAVLSPESYDDRTRPSARATTFETTLLLTEAEEEGARDTSNLYCHGLVQL